MAKKSAKPARKQDVPIASKQFNPLFRHIGAYAVILIAAMLYFKPVAFDGKALGQHANLQSTGLRSTIPSKHGNSLPYSSRIPIHGLVYLLLCYLVISPLFCWG